MEFPFLLRVGKLTQSVVDDHASMHVSALVIRLLTSAASSWLPCYWAC